MIEQHRPTPTVTQGDDIQMLQVMPALTTDEYDALVADIRANGVLVSVLVGQYGRTVDGHHRRRAAAEVGVDCPTVTRQIGDDEEARQLAVSLNAARRHLTREQRQDLVVTELRIRPDDSDRAIARRVGCSPSTVGKFRSQVSKLDTQITREKAEDLTRRAQRLILRADTLCLIALLQGVSPAELVEAITSGVPADILDLLWQPVIRPGIGGLYSWPVGGFYRRYALEVLTWREWGDNYDAEIAKAAERLLAAEY